MAVDLAANRGLMGTTVVLSVMSYHSPTGDRRTILRLMAGVTIGGLAGCVGSGGGTDRFVEDEPDYGDWFDDANGYEGTVDGRGKDRITVMVGAGEDHIAFEPAAVMVDRGTTVVWEWTGEGGTHNVAHEPQTRNEDPIFLSDPAREAGTTFEWTLDDSGIYRYVCQPHRLVGMKGAITVRE